MVTYGADPELMLFDREKNSIVSSIPVLKRDKHNPIELNHCKMYSDNVLVEFSFDPVKNKKDFLNKIDCIFKEAHSFLGKRYSLLPQTCYEFPNTELNKAYGIDPKEIGCTPSLNVYTLDQSEIKPFASGKRSGSFHIHLGGEKLQEFNTKNNTIKLLDLIVGCSSVVFCKDKTAKERREYYGKAGEFRETSYGLEYRVLDNFCLSNPRLTELVMDLVDYTLDIVYSDKSEQVLSKFKPEEVQKAINTSNKGLAMKLINKVLTNNLITRVKAEYVIRHLENW